MLDVEVPSKKYRDGWVVWKTASPCCGRLRVHVFAADLHEIECECGNWFLTPLGQRHADAAERVN